MGKYCCFQSTWIGMIEEISLNLPVTDENLLSVCVCVWSILSIRTWSVAVIVINQNSSAASKCTQEKTRGAVIPHFTCSFVSHCRGDGDDKFHMAPPPHSRTYPLPPPFFFSIRNGSYFALCCVTPTEYFSSAVSLFFCHLCKRRWELFWLWATLYPLHRSKIPQ